MWSCLQNFSKDSPASHDVHEVRSDVAVFPVAHVMHVVEPMIWLYFPTEHNVQFRSSVQYGSVQFRSSAFEIMAAVLYRPISHAWQVLSESRYSPAPHWAVGSGVGEKDWDGYLTERKGNRRGKKSKRTDMVMDG